MIYMSLNHTPILIQTWNEQQRERERMRKEKKSFINTETSKQIALVIIMYPIYELKQEYGVFLFEKYSII